MRVDQTIATGETQAGRPGRWRGWRIQGLTLLAFGFWAPVALAQTTVPPPAESKPVFQWIFAAAMVILVCIPAFKNPRRSHLG